jgi:adenylosuccinate lyase
VDELSRHAERLAQGWDRLNSTSLLGGGAGTYASFGGGGPGVAARYAARLGLAASSATHRITEAPTRPCWRLPIRKPKCLVL